MNRIIFSFYGILYGFGGRTGSSRDFRHCWPNIEKNLVNPYREKGYETQIHFSSYFFSEKEIENQFYELIKPNKVLFNTIENSDPFTSKFASFENFENEDADIIIFSRCDVHYNKILFNENIDYSKFNFLFREKEWWDTNRFSCDNFYIWPQKFTSSIKKAFRETYRYPRPGYVDTHGLYNKLIPYIGEEQTHFISEVQEISDVNSYYTCCRSDLPRRDCMNEEVKQRHLTENWSYYL